MRHLRPKLIHVVADGRTLDRLLGYQLHRFFDEGFDVIAVSPSTPASGSDEDRVRHIALPALAVEAGTGTLLRSFAQLVRLFRRERPAIVHAHDDGSHLASLAAARAAGTPVSVATLRRSGVPRHDFSRTIRRAAHHRFLEREEDPPRCFPPDGHTTWIGFGVDLERFDPGAVDAIELVGARRSWRVPEGGSVVAAERPTPELLAALRRVGRTHPDAVLACSSSSPGSSSAGAVAGCRTILDRLPLVHAAADVVVVGEAATVPRDAVEAAAMGKAVIAADSAGAREVVLDGVTGVLVPPRDARALSEAIEELLSAPDRAEVLGKAARERAVDRFDEDGVVERVVQVYRRLLRAHGIRWDGELPDR